MPIVAALRRLRALLVLSLSSALFCSAALAEDVVLPITGTARLPDGSPAARAIVSTYGDPNIGGLDESVRADDQGRFQLGKIVSHTYRLHVRSSDGKFQTALTVPPSQARVTFARPLELRLAAAERHVVTVLSNGKPVAAAHLVAKGDSYRVSGQTAADGRVELLVPANQRLNELVAWHPELGVDGRRRLNERPRQAATELSLLRPAPLKIRVVDTENKPVANLPISMSVSTEGGNWIISADVEASHVRTNANGEATLPWAPAEKLSYVEVNLLASNWKLDEVSRDQLALRLAVVHARREVPVEGRLVMPEGESAAGVLITGFGYGPGDHGDIPVVRTRADGTFTMSVSWDHGYVMGVIDPEWASDLWTGLILAGETAMPSELTLKASRAAPTTIRVTRGPDRSPVADAWIYPRIERDFEWTDAKGEKQYAGGGPGGWLRTNGEGVALTGLGRGEHDVRLAVGDWSETRKIHVTSGQPLQIDFHRPWLADRKLVGRITRNDEAYQPSAAATVKIWSHDELSQADLVTPPIRHDGSFEFVLDAKEMSILVTDGERRLAGYLRSDAIEKGPIDLAMQPMASYSGQVVDASGLSPGRVRLRMAVKDSRAGRDWVWAAADQVTDDDGRFRYDALPAGVPLVLWGYDAKLGTESSLLSQEKLFLPGEVRAGERVAVRSAGGRSARLALAATLEQTIRDARLCGMRTLVMLQGDASATTQKVTDTLLDHEQFKEILSFRPVVVTSPVNEADAATLAQKGWAPPGEETLTLVALDDQGKTLDVTRVPLLDAQIGLELASGFVKRNMPPKRDARALVVAAREEAKRSGRRVWIVYGGPRCGPCFRLARWMDDQQGLLEKDFVIMKFLQVIDKNAQSVVGDLPVRPGDGIPWMAVTESDGTILATSNGPLGNIGFPTELENRRHLREMLDRTVQRLTPEECDELIKSLELPK
jgi:hypothetical protein